MHAVLLAARLYMLNMSDQQHTFQCEAMWAAAILYLQSRLQSWAQRHMCANCTARTLQRASASAFWWASMRRRSSAPSTRCVSASARMSAAAAAASTSAQRALTCWEGNQSKTNQRAEPAATGTRCLAAHCMGGVFLALPTPVHMRSCAPFAFHSPPTELR